MRRRTEDEMSTDSEYESEGCSTTDKKSGPPPPPPPPPPSGGSGDNGSGLNTWTGASQNVSQQTTSDWSFSRNTTGYKPQDEEYLTESDDEVKNIVEMVRYLSELCTTFNLTEIMCNANINEYNYLQRIRQLNERTSKLKFTPRGRGTSKVSTRGRRSPALSKPCAERRAVQDDMANLKSSPSGSHFDQGKWRVAEQKAWLQCYYTEPVSDRESNDLSRWQAFSNRLREEFDVHRSSIQCCKQVLYK